MPSIHDKGFADAGQGERVRVPLADGTGLVAPWRWSSALGRAAIDRTVAEFGRLDMAFNNAGIQVPFSNAPCR